MAAGLFFGDGVMGNKGHIGLGRSDANELCVGTTAGGTSELAYP